MAVKNYTENWLDTYKSYLGSINFTAGDFDSLKAVIRDYVVRQNPEGYNDWQESSEVGMFVNAIAYLGENINYRIDLNVNDLFPSTTTRKQSLLNFTKMLSYASKRNIGATGLAKLVSISTTQDVKDSLGTLLQGVPIKWNDQTNDNWMEQFLTVMNNAFTYTNQFGKPIKKISLNNISNQLYQFNSAVNSTTVYPFSSLINGSSMNFEVVNPDIDIDESAVVEMPPIPERMTNILYRNDGAGNASNNTGFFVFWKQGNLVNEIYQFDEKVENNSIQIDKENINNTDVWFQELNRDTGYVTKNWTKLASNELLSYSSTDNNIRTIYKVETNENDKITLKFPDGRFGDIPFGTYRAWFRTSDGNKGLYIKPSDMTNISIRIPYFNNKNNNEENVYYLTLTFSVVDVSHIRQAVPTESMESIRENAPNVYSTQDRMVSAKDYNYFPKTFGQSLRVLNAVERTYAGNTRYTDLNDATGTYSDVNLIATDGYMYIKTDYTTSTVSESVSPDIIFDRYISSTLTTKELTNLYYYNYEGEFIPSTSDDQNTVNYYLWEPTMVDGINTMSGKLSIYTYKVNQPKNSTITKDKNKVLTDIKVGDMICFQEFQNDLIDDGGKNNNIYTPLKSAVIWAKVMDVKEIENDDVEIKISEVLDVNKSWGIRKGAKSSKEWSKIPSFVTTMTKEEREKIILQMNKSSNKTSFGITYVQGYDEDTKRPGRWEIVTSTGQPTEGSSDILNQTHNTSSTKMYLEDNTAKMVRYELDSMDGTKTLNWIYRLTYNNGNWIIDRNECKIIFGSANETSFYFNTSIKTDTVHGYFKTNDVVKVMKENNNVDRDYYWKPYNVIKYADGYINQQEFVCEPYDSDKDASIDVPTQLQEMIKDTKPIIFLYNDGGELNDNKYLNFVDLYSTYDETKEINDEAYKHSLWGRTLTSGYYLTYHRMKEVICSGQISNDTSKTKFVTPKKSNVPLSNGSFKTFNGNSVNILENETLDYDFVDYIDRYEGAYTPKFYDDIIAYDSVGNPIYKHGYLYKYNASTKKLEEIDETKYTLINGVSGLTFLWKHKATEDYVIDPCSTNIIDMFVLTNDYYNEVQTWVQNGKSTQFPKAPSAYELKGIFSSLEENKMISDTLVWHPIKYKLVFGANAESDTHCIFKVIKKNELISDNEVKKKVVYLIDTYFQNMEVGETFYFTKLATYIENSIPDLINTIVIVPTDTTNKFGKLFEIKCDINEILLSSATLDDVQIISMITDQNIRAM